MPIEDDAIREARDLVEQDIVDGLAPYLVPAATDGPSFSLDVLGMENDADVMSRSERVISAPWRFTCRHVGKLFGIPPTYVTFELRGVTIVVADNKPSSQWTYYRVIDWMSALQAFGVPTSFRPMLTPEEFENWREQDRLAKDRESSG